MFRRATSWITPLSSAIASTPLLVITGTTASGKDSTAVTVAEALSGEVVALDSMKVYRGMDVGTDKPTLHERRAVPHHMLDLLDPLEAMNLRRYVDLAREAVGAIRGRGHQPLVVGGTALYLKGFLQGVFEGPSADLELRGRLRAEAALGGVPLLHQRLALHDPPTAARLHPNDYKRIERALEVWELTGIPLSSHLGQWEQQPVLAAVVCVLTWPREELDKRINERVGRMFDTGLLEEVQRIQATGGFGTQSAQAVGYREAVAVLDGSLTRSAAVDLVQRRTRQFARKQLTWFRSIKEACWIEARSGDSAESLAPRVLEHWERAGRCV